MRLPVDFLSRKGHQPEFRSHDIALDRSSVGEQAAANDIRPIIRAKHNEKQFDVS